MRKAPASFAAVAKAKSEDPASAEQGGDLGVIGKDGLPAPLLSAVSKLKQGEISDVVASDFGYHILTVTSLKPQHVRALDEVRGEITADLRKQFAAKKYSEMAETFTNTVYEQSDSLKPVADKLKLKVETVANLSRTPSPALGKAPFNNAKFLDRHLLERFAERQAQHGSRHRCTERADRRPRGGIQACLEASAG